MSLKIIDQFPFEFYGDHFTVALARDRNLYVPMESLCRSMGLQTHGQVRRIRDNEAISDTLISLSIAWAYGDEAVQEREMICLRLDMLPFWMGTLQPSRIPDEGKRERIIHFQREFASVAWAAFRREILPDDMLAEMDSSLPLEQQEYLQLMDEAAELRQRLSQHDTNLQAHDTQLDDLQKRVAALEARLQGTDFLNPAQMKEYTDMVGLVARQLKRKKKGNEATVHAEVK